MLRARSSTEVAMPVHTLNTGASAGMSRIAANSAVTTSVT
jgi:hypothetical protein